MRIRNYLFIIAAYFLFFVIGIDSIRAVALSQTQIEEIESYCNSELSNSLLPGFSIGIVKDDEVVYKNGFGRADIVSTPITASTPMYIGSISKSFTAMAIMQLYEAGKIDIDKKVIDYLPWFKMANKTASDMITVRHLLNQLSGIPTKTGIKNLYQVVETPEEYVRNLSVDPIVSTPGTKYQYSNTNYAILGLLVENRTGISYGQYIQANIWDKLDMSNTYYNRTEAIEGGLAWGHRVIYGLQLPNNEPINPAYLSGGGIITTAEDMTNFMIAQLNNGKFGSETLLTPASVEAMHTPPQNLDSNYGMGWRNSTFEGVPVILHGGTLIDYHASLLLAPEDGWGVIYIANAYNIFGAEFSYGVAKNILRMLLEKPIQPGYNLIILAIIGDLIVGTTLAIIIYRDIMLAKKTFGKKEIQEKQSERESNKGDIAKIIIYLTGSVILLFVMPYFISTSFLGYSVTILFMLWALPDFALWLLIGAIGGIISSILHVINITKVREKKFRE